MAGGQSEEMTAVLPSLPGEGGVASDQTCTLYSFPYIYMVLPLHRVPIKCPGTHCLSKQNRDDRPDQKCNPEQRKESGRSLWDESPASVFPRTGTADAERSPLVYAFHFLCPVYVGSEKSGRLRSGDNGASEHLRASYIPAGPRSAADQVTLQGTAHASVL